MIMIFPRRLAALALAAACALPVSVPAQGSARNLVATERVRAELMAHAPDGVGPGKQVWLGLQLTHQPEWHTYWKNSGDSGLPTQLQWTLPPGVVAGDIAWPVPRKIPIGHLANYGYEGTVLLPVPLTITPDFKPSLLGSELQVKLKATWLVCRMECIPGRRRVCAGGADTQHHGAQRRRLPGQLRGPAQTPGQREPGPHRGPGDPGQRARPAAGIAWQDAGVLPRNR